MIVLSIRTDSPDAEVGLFYDLEQKEYEVWRADRELSLTILQKIQQVLERSSHSFQQLEGIVVYSGPGSFTGLRIGISVANTLAYGLRIPIVGSSAEAWIQEGISRLKSGENTKVTLPDYGSEPNVSQTKK